MVPRKLQQLTSDVSGEATARNLMCSHSARPASSQHGQPQRQMGGIRPGTAIAGQQWRLQRQAQGAVAGVAAAGCCISRGHGG
eukprot:9337224-Alexandrium_andersonii.AAC.1